METQNNDISLRTDPIVLYLIVKSSLNMSIGKTCAQTGHAVGLLVADYYEEWLRRMDFENKFNELKFTDEQIELFGKWQLEDYTKITLSANDEEFEKIKSEFQSPAIVVVKDNGWTEVPAGSETCIGLLPIRKSSRPKILKKLKLL